MQLSYQYSIISIRFSAKQENGSVMMMCTSMLSYALESLLLAVEFKSCLEGHPKQRIGARGNL